MQELRRSVIHSILETLVTALKCSVPHRYTAINPMDSSRFTLRITSYVDDCSSAVNLLKEDMLLLEGLSKTPMYCDLLDKIKMVTDS